MCKKVFSFLAVALVVLCFSLSAVQAETVPIGSGDAVYRDMDTPFLFMCLVGHTGIYIGGKTVVHMQSAGCQKVDFSNFFDKMYWGSSYAGNSDAAKKRVAEANRLFDKVKPQFNWTSYKSFGAKKPCGRCDGLSEWCFEKAGNDVTNDSSCATLTPQKQWKSGKVTRRYTTFFGNLALSTALVPWINM